MGKHSRLSLKISYIDKEALEKIANAESESVAVIVRRLVRQFTKSYQLPPAPTPPAPALEVEP